MRIFLEFDHADGQWIWKLSSGVELLQMGKRGTAREALIDALRHRVNTLVKERERADQVVAAVHYERGRCDLELADLDASDPAKTEPVPTKTEPVTVPTPAFLGGQI